MNQSAVDHMARSPALDFVELRSANHSNNCYSSHSHDEFSFGVVDFGSAKYQNLSSQYTTYAGVTVTINPGDAHSCNPAAGDWSYRMLFVNTQWIGELQREFLPQQSMDYVPFEQHLLSDTGNYQRFSQLYETLLVETDPLQAEGLLIEYCTQLFTGQTMQTPTTQTNLSLVQQMIMDQLGSALTLNDFCQLVNMSPYHLIRCFKQNYGQSPHAYQLDQRIKRARTLLKEGMSLSTIADLLGFADQSHFQRNFKKRTALTPRQYQQFFTG